MCDHDWRPLVPCDNNDERICAMLASLHDYITCQTCGRLGKRHGRNVTVWSYPEMEALIRERAAGHVAARSENKRQSLSE